MTFLRILMERVLPPDENVLNATFDTHGRGGGGEKTDKPLNRCM